MNELHLKINLVTQALSSDQAKPNKVVSALKNFSGLDMTNFSKKMMNTIHQHFGEINSITSQYKIKTEDDYKIITDNDLNKILKNIQQLCLKLLLTESSEARIK